MSTAEATRNNGHDEFSPTAGSLFERVPTITPAAMLNAKLATDPTEPTFQKVTSEQFARLFDQQIGCDPGYLDAVSLLESVKASPRSKDDKPSTGAATDSPAGARIHDLELAVEKARRKKEAFARQLKKTEVVVADNDDGAFEIKHLNYQLESLMHLEEQVKKIWNKSSTT